MTTLSNQQKQLLFDYCTGLTSQEQSTEATRLISANKEAAEICSTIKASLSPLDSLEPESCPDELAESTILRLNNAARSSQLQLQELLAAEQSRKVTTKSWFWRNAGPRLANAALFMIVGGVAITAFNAAARVLRQISLQNQCQMQLARMSQGINHYSSDFDGKLPAVATAAGAPWWKVGDQGQENQSNTRHIYLLVKGGYVKPSAFICPGKRQRQAVMFDLSQVKKYNDFPDKSCVTYSLRIKADKPLKACPPGEKALIADLNPLFEVLPHYYSTPLKLRPNKELLTLNSINHNRRGQNVLFCDGSVKFLKGRHIGIAADDIFTLQNTDLYEGVEVPSCETDAFLAP